MNDHDKTKGQLIAERDELQRRVAALEGVETQRRRAEAALQQSEQRYRLLMETIPQIVWRCDPDGNVLDCSRHWCRYTGQTLEESKGKNWMKMLHPDDVARFGQRIGTERAKAEVLQSEHRLRCAADGCYRWHLARSVPLIDDHGNLAGWIGSTTDIDDLKRAEEALRGSEDHYRLLAEAIPQPVWRSDSQGNVIEFNRRWYEYTGQTAEEARGFGWLKVVHPDDLARVAEQVRASVSAGKNLQIEGRIRRAADGTYHWHLARSIPLKDKDGTITARFGSVTDIDEQKQVEEELARSKAILQATVENLPFDFFAIGTDGRYLLENAACRATWGPLAGKTPAEMAPSEEVRTLWLDNNRRAFAGEKVEDEAKILVQGEERFIYNVVSPIRVGEEILGVLGINIDITERKRAEEELKKAHDELEQRVQQRTAELTQANEDLAMFRRFAEAAGQGFGMADLDGQLTYLNPTLCRLFGEERPEAAIGKHLSNYFSEDSNRRGEQEIRPALQHAGHWEGELPLRSRQGRSIPNWHNAFMIRDERGCPLRLAMVITDITERKQAEEALRQSEAQIRSLAELLPIAVLAICQRKIVWANLEAARLYRATKPEELLGRDVLELVPEDRRRILSADLERHLAQLEAVPFHEGAVLCLDGTRAEVEAGGTPFRFDGRPGALLVIRDITERKQAEEALRASEERFRSYFEQGLIGMAVTSLDKQWLEVNDRLCEILGYSREELLTMRWPEATHPDDLECSQVRFSGLLANEIDHYTLDKRFFRKDGGLVYATVFVRRFRSKDGTEDHILALIEDITQRKQAEKALQRERRTLAHMLRASDHERQLIAYDIHDGLAQYLGGAIMQFQTYEHLKDKQRQEAAKAYSGGMTMLKQSHFEARRLISGVRPPILDESGVLAAIAHLVHDPSFEFGPKVEFRSKVTFNRLASVLENAIYRIVQEGLSNACHHSKSPKVRISLLQRGERVRIEIRDWGVGFEPNKVQENRFGLAGIRERARLLGGKCRIRSKPANDTSIVVELPVVEREEEQ